jgi:cytochrome c551/c552
MFVPRSLLLSVSLVVGACSVGEVPGSGSSPGVDGGSTPAVTIGSASGFTANVVPILMSKGCVTCHSGGTAPNFTSYTTLDTKYKSSPTSSNVLLTHVADGALHNGVPYLSTSDKATITSWITAGGG